jgi:general secretion pathway protein M
MMNINLNQREKIAISGAGAFLIIFIMVQWLIVPVFEKRDDLKTRLDSKKNILMDMKILRSDYLDMQQKAESSRQRLSNRQPGFTLFSFLDQLAGDTGLKDHIEYMKPSTAVKEDSGLKISRVELKLQEITVKDLTAYLFKVETSPNMLIVKRLSITRTGKDSGLVSAVLQVETFES